MRQLSTVMMERPCVAAGGEVLHNLRPPGEEEEERFKAAGVAQRARAQGGGSSGVLDALEAAEAAHEAAADDTRGDPAHICTAEPATCR